MLSFPCEKSKFLSCPSVIGKLRALRHTLWCLRQNQSNNGVVPTGLEPADGRLPALQGPRGADSQRLPENLKAVISAYPHLFVLSYSVTEMFGLLKF